MGCRSSKYSSPESKILSHIDLISSVSIKCKIDPSIPDDKVEELIRIELRAIIDVAKCEHSLRPSIFHDLVMALDELSLTRESVAAKMKVITAATEKVIRMKCIGKTKQDQREDDELQESLHVIQKVLNLSHHSSNSDNNNIMHKKSTQKCSTARLRKLVTDSNGDYNTSIHDGGSDYGFFDIGSSYNGSIFGSSRHGGATQQASYHGSPYGPTQSPNTKPISPQMQSLTSTPVPVSNQMSVSGTSCTNTSAIKTTTASKFVYNTSFTRG